MFRILPLLTLSLLTGCMTTGQEIEVSPCIRISAEEDKAILKYGPEEWTDISPSGYYFAECGNGSYTLCIIPVTVNRAGGSQHTVYTVVKITQEDLLDVTHTTVTNALFYRKGILEGSETEGEYTDKTYGVLRMGKKHPLVLVDVDGNYYNRIELNPRQHRSNLHDIFQKKGKIGTAFDGLCIIKCHVNNETERLHNVVLIEQVSPASTPIITLYQNLQLRGDYLCDGGGAQLFSVQHSKNGTTLTDKHGRSYTAMSRQFTHEPIPSPFAP